MQIKYDQKTKTVTLTFTYDPEKSYPASKTGKSAVFASTHGFAAVPGTDGRVSVNAICPLKAV